VAGIVGVRLLLCVGVWVRVFAIVAVAGFSEEGFPVFPAVAEEFGEADRQLNKTTADASRKIPNSLFMYASRKIFVE
jgi:hypothetical protein